ncbi:hypothetical protein GCM10023093_22350 [Nemorincola caseinilytica]|uniref:Uncharacterized protein n=1 Tax=Nemorincola caseinilytica TaxID=2054315 RepID=A0ABP8NKZ7_9BACT
MRTLNISISELEFNKFGLKKEKLSFSDLLEILSNELSKQNLNDSIELAEKYGLSKMTMDEITKEVNAVRHAKDHS